MVIDITEPIRRLAVKAINSEIESSSAEKELERLKKKYGDAYTTKELSKHFEVVGFMAPFVIVRNKETGDKGTLEFQHSPRIYFNFEASK